MSDKVYVIKIDISNKKDNIKVNANILTTSKPGVTFIGEVNNTLAIEYSKEVVLQEDISCCIKNGIALITKHDGYVLVYVSNNPDIPKDNNKFMNYVDNYINEFIGKEDTED